MAPIPIPEADYSFVVAAARQLHPPPLVGYYPQPDPGLVIVGAILSIAPIIAGAIAGPRHYGYGVAPRHSSFGYGYGRRW